MRRLVANAAGYRKMAEVWHNALIAVPGSIGDPQVPSDGVCTAAARVAGSWNGGFQGEVTVANTSAAALKGWTVRLVLPGGQTITQIWGGTASGTNPVTIRNVSYNGTVGPAASTVFGFMLSSR